MDKGTASKSKKVNFEDTDRDREGSQVIEGGRVTPSLVKVRTCAHPDCFIAFLFSAVHLHDMYIVCFDCLLSGVSSDYLSLQPEFNWHLHPLTLRFLLSPCHYRDPCPRPFSAPPSAMRYSHVDLYQDSLDLRTRFLEFIYRAELGRSDPC
jgi:hypothetical protein